MVYKIAYDKHAKNNLKKIPSAEVNKIKQKIITLRDNPRNRTDVKRLVTNNNNDQLYRLRVGKYRVIYEIKVDIIVVLIMKIAHRKDVYQGF